MKFRRVNARFSNSLLPSHRVGVSFDCESHGASIEEWQDILRERLRAIVRQPEQWYLTYFVVMDIEERRAEEIAREEIDTAAAKLHELAPELNIPERLEAIRKGKV